MTGLAPISPEIDKDRFGTFNSPLKETTDFQVASAQSLRLQYVA